jgi:HEPN domain-containing protein
MKPEKEEALRWARYAEDDWEYGLLGLESHPRGASWNFHQAAEKYLKAVLLSGGIEPPRSHDLLLLLGLAEPHLAVDSEIVMAASDLALFGVVRRYPGDLPEVGLEAARYAQAQAAVIRGFARERLGL